MIRLVGLLFLTLWAALSANADVEKPKFQIGAILPLSGPGAAVGETFSKGLLLGAEYLNAHEGINGHEVEVIFEDTRSETKNAVTAFNKLTTIHKINVIFTTLTSMLTATVLQSLNVHSLTTFWLPSRFVALHEHYHFFDIPENE